MTEAHFFPKGIILAGGTGSRLYPVTLAVSKQLLPVFDKPLVYYSLSTLMLARIRNVLLISTPHDRPAFELVLGDGAHIGMSIEYAQQDHPGGIAEALLVGKSFIGDGNIALILGDNIFYGQGLQEKLHLATRRRDGATVYAYTVQDPGRYGIVELDAAGNPRSLEEKPSNAKSALAVTGLYFYDRQAVALASELEPSARGELEITELNRRYLQQGTLHVEQFGRGFTWLDAGTEQSLLQAANLIESVQRRQGLRIACIEEIAYRMGFISARQLATLGQKMTGPYGTYVREVAASAQ